MNTVKDAIFSILLSKNHEKNLLTNCRINFIILLLKMLGGDNMDEKKFIEILEKNNEKIIKSIKSETNGKISGLKEIMEQRV